MNMHFTQPDPHETFDPHTTTQVSVDRVYVGAVHTYYQGYGRYAFGGGPAIAHLTNDQQSWVWDTHDTYTVSLFPHARRHG